MNVSCSWKQPGTLFFVLLPDLPFSSLGLPVNSTAETRTARGDDLSHSVLSAAFKVHTALGPGVLESAYEACLCHELTKGSIPFRRQVTMPIRYDGFLIDCGFRADLLVDERLIVEIKAVEHLLDVHERQLATYLRASGLRAGLLINFHVSHLKEGIRRIMK